MAAKKAEALHDWIDSQSRRWLPAQARLCRQRFPVSKGDLIGVLAGLPDEGTRTAKPPGSSPIHPHLLYIIRYAVFDINYYIIYCAYIGSSAGREGAL